MTEPDLDRRVRQLGNDVDAIYDILRDIQNEVRSTAARSDRMFEGVDAKFSVLDAKFTGMFEGVDARFDALDAKFSGKFDSVDAKFDSVDAKLDLVLARIGHAGN